MGVILVVIAWWPDPQLEGEGSDFDVLPAARSACPPDGGFRRIELLHLIGATDLDVRAMVALIDEQFPLADAGVERETDSH